MNTWDWIAWALDNDNDAQRFVLRCHSTGHTNAKKVLNNNAGALQSVQGACKALLQYNIFQYAADGTVTLRGDGDKIWELCLPVLQKKVSTFQDMQTRHLATVQQHPLEMALLQALERECAARVAIPMDEFMSASWASGSGITQSTCHRLLSCHLVCTLTLGKLQFVLPRLWPMMSPNGEVGRRIKEILLQTPPPTLLPPPQPPPYDDFVSAALASESSSFEVYPASPPDAEAEGGGAAASRARGDAEGALAGALAEPDHRCA